MQLHLIVLALSAWPSTTTCSAARLGIGPGETTATLQDNPEDRALLGEPLFVNGRRVTYDELKLALIYGPCSMLLDLSKVGMLIEDEINRQCEEKAEAEVAAKDQEKAFGSPDERAKAKQAALARLCS